MIAPKFKSREGECPHLLTPMEYWRHTEIFGPVRSVCSLRPRPEVLIQLSLPVDLMMHCAFGREWEGCMILGKFQGSNGSNFLLKVVWKPLLLTLQSPPLPSEFFSWSAKVTTVFHFGKPKHKILHSTGPKRSQHFIYFKSLQCSLSTANVHKWQRFIPVLYKYIGQVRHAIYRPGPQ